jgi:hypothetical protein
MSMSAGNTAIGMFCHNPTTCNIYTDGSRGCVTPKQIENLIEVSGGDTDMVDGYDELPAEYQEKVRFALENGHIPDEDCTRVSIFDTLNNYPGSCY